MGAHAGIVRDAPIARAGELAVRLGQSLPRGDGAVERLTRQNCVVCHRPLDAGRNEQQPYHSPAGVIVVLEGRLFDRDALCRSMGILRGNLPDAALVSAAYARWGARCFERLDGDWSVGLYDPASDVVLLATDFSGAVPLFYAADEHETMWSSELDTFIAFDRQGPLSRDYLAQFIWRETAYGQTPYDRVKSVQPGCVVTLKSGRETISTGCYPDFEMRLGCRGDAEYEEAFRSVFRTIISDRLAARGQVWAELSGGLDSSSIVCVGDRILQETGASPEKLLAVSYRFIGGDFEDDATHYAAARAAIRCPSIEITPDVDETESRLALVPLISGGVISELARRMRAANTRTLLSGEGGDAVMWSHGPWGPCWSLHEDLFSGYWRRFRHDLFEFSRESHRSVWDIVRRDVFTVRKWVPGSVPRKSPRWLNQEWAARSFAQSLRSTCVVDLSAARTSTRLAFYPIDGARHVLTRLVERYTGVIDESFPYFDRRLVQFMLAIPFQQRFRPWQTRSLQRRALTGILPPLIQARTTKSSGLGPMMRSLRANWAIHETLLDEECGLAQMGLVDLVGLREDATALKNGLSVPKSAAVFQALMAERWVRERQGRAVDVRTEVAV